MKASASDVPEAQGSRHSLTAFGLNVECDWPITGSRPSPPGAAESKPATSVRLLPPEQIDAAWDEPAERIFEPADPDGKTRFTIDRSDHHFRFMLEGFGRCLVTVDGTEVDCERGLVSHDHQERFVFAQALPLAAILHGYEVLHASAVCGDHGVAAFAGASRAGKTTLVSRLVLRGANFVTDDVLALEPAHGAPRVHPGPPFMAVPNEDRLLIDSGKGRLGSVVGSTDKVHASPSVRGWGLRLQAVYYLEPGPSVQITALDGAGAQRILASVFAPYLMTPDRLYRHLDLAQQVSSEVSQFRLQVPRTGRFDDIVETLEAHLRELGI